MSGEAQHRMMSLQSISSPRSQSVTSNRINNADSSVASSQQTRFSFYNAEDFKVMSQQDSSPGKEQRQEQQPLRFNFYNAEEMKRTPNTANVSKTMEVTHDVNEGKSLDSVEILKSLHEHEQQRLEILSDPKKTTTTPSNSSHSNSLQNNSTSFNGGYSSGENSNPYEDAIKEALQLLRKHRSMPRISAPQPVVERIETEPPESDMLERIRSNDFDEHQEQLQQEFQDLMIRTRSPPITAPSRLNAGAGQWEETMEQTPLSDAGLGDAYQAEIESRRKQRQERMARYASRLAELKQDDDDGGPPMVNTAHSLDSSVDYSNCGANGIARGSAFQQHQWDRDLQIATSLSWEDDAIVAARSTNGFTPKDVLAPAFSVEGSMSTLSNTNRPEDEVQRGVERVLLAILERANSRGRSALESNIFPSDTNVRQQLLTPAIPVENKPNPEEPELRNTIPSTFYPQPDDALLRAMSDLLGPRSIASIAAATESDNEDDPSNSFATQDEPTALLVASQTSRGKNALSSVIAANDYTILTHNSSIDPGNEMPHSVASTDSTRDAAHYELDRMVERVFQLDGDDDAGVHSNKEYASRSSSKDELAPVNGEARMDRNIDTSASAGADTASDDDNESVDERSRSSDRSSDSIGSSQVVDGEVPDDTLTTDHEDDTGSFDGSSGNEYDSEEASARYSGVLGPLSNRSEETTDIVLENSSSSSTSSDDEDIPRSQGVSVTSPTILESLSAAVSMVTGIASNEVKQPLPPSSRKDKYAVDGLKTDDDSDVDPEAHDLMRSLCAHLLPLGVDQSSRLLENVPEWDESNTDEAGYRIVRLTSLQLRHIQNEYNRMVESLKHKSQRNLCLTSADAIDESTFERDLKAAEDLLDQEENRVKKAEKVLTVLTVTSPHSSAKSGNLNERTDFSDSDSLTDTKLDTPQFLAGFSGIKPAGKGEMGDLEFFTLPIIFKSHVTGFEPTKDLILEPGNVVAGQYLVEGVLGSAAFSTAYKCTDLNSEEDSFGCQDLVCLKVIKNTKDFFDQSLDEIKILELLRQTGKCNDNYIVEMKAFFYHREHLIIVTELLRQNLFEFGKFILDSGEEPYFTIARLSYITWQCLVALNFVHSLGLVHSDVKPENILLASYSRAQAKLIDFGSSCYLTDRQSSYIQSRSYRAPEVVLGLPYDGRIDIWSLGCVVAEMFTGEVTFQNDSVVSMLSRIEAICGPFPRHMIVQGRQSSRFFTKCGLLYEKVSYDNDENHDDSFSGDSSTNEDDRHKPSHIDIFQPKRTTLSARLGFAPDLIEKFDSGKQLSVDEQQQARFTDLVRRLLTIDPEARLTAAEALNHPAMLYAATLTEADIKYPSG